MMGIRSGQGRIASDIHAIGDKAIIRF